MAAAAQEPAPAKAAVIRAYHGDHLVARCECDSQNMSGGLARRGREAQGREPRASAFGPAEGGPRGFGLFEGSGIRGYRTCGMSPESVLCYCRCVVAVRLQSEPLASEANIQAMVQERAPKAVRSEGTGITHGFRLCRLHRNLESPPMST